MLPSHPHHTHLLEDGELEELDGHVGVLHVHGGAQSALGVSRGQTDQRLQRSGRDRLGLGTGVSVTDPRNDVHHRQVENGAKSQCKRNGVWWSIETSCTN